jgi:hypothetical protein
VLIRIGPPIALVLVLCAGCTPGGQFDPTSIFANDMFDTKTKLKGEREPVFPNGVPGAENGVPPELVKGYQPPPDQTADTGSSAPGAPPAPGTDAAAPAAEAAAKPKPKPKPRPKLARAPAQSQDPAFEQKPPTRITVGPKAAAPAAPARSDNSVWPAPPPTGPAQKAAGPSDSIWPAPPQTAPAKQTAQPAQPAQPAWPNPPATSNQ